MLDTGTIRSVKSALALARLRKIDEAVKSLEYAHRLVKSDVAQVSVERDAKAIEEILESSSARPSKFSDSTPINDGLVRSLFETGHYIEALQRAVEHADVERKKNPEIAHSDPTQRLPFTVLEQVTPRYTLIDIKDHSYGWGL